MNNKVLVNNIKNLCKSNNISISQLEKELYMSPGLISRWVKSTPTFDRIVDIANYFDISIDVLVKNSNDKENNSQSIDKLISILYDKTIEADIEWYVYDTNIHENIKKMLLTVNQENMDYFYCVVNEGGFILAIKHYSIDDIKLFLYTFADQYSYLEMVCSNIDKLTHLYNYLIKRLGKKLNQIKTNKFIYDFICQNSTIGDRSIENDKITMFYNAVNE